MAPKVEKLFGFYTIKDFQVAYCIIVLVISLLVNGAFGNPISGGSSNNLNSISDEVTTHVLNDIIITETGAEIQNTEQIENTGVTGTEGTDQLLPVLSPSDELTQNHVSIDADNNPSTESKNCEDVPKDDLEGLWKRDVNGNNRNISSSVVYPGIQCSAKVLEEFSNSSDAKDRSICPYQLEVDYVSHRFPNTLEYVRCKCEYGITLNGRDPSFNLNYGCRPQMYPVNVLVYKGECINGYKKFVMETINVPVACVPVKTT